MDEVITLLTAPAILALVNLFKALGMSSKLAPAAAVLIGLSLALFEFYGSPDFVQTIERGLIVALSAAGLWDISSTSSRAPAPTTARRALEDTSENKLELENV